MNCWKAEVFIRAENELGEGPEWNPIRQKLSWVDILAKKFHWFDFELNKQFSMDTKQVIGFAIPTTKHSTYISGQLDELIEFDIDSKQSRVLKTISENKKWNRFNDAKCDPRGRLWAGTMTDDIKHSQGALYRIDANMAITKVLPSVGCSNGTCWSADGRTMYYIDTSTLQLRSYAFDLELGFISEEKIILEWPAEKGYLDGMTIDGEGKLWIAIWNGSKVIRYCPKSQKILGEVLVNCRKPTSVVFGGKNLEKLFITSARVGSDPQIISQNPEEGALFVVETKIQGTQNHIFQMN